MTKKDYELIGEAFKRSKPHSFEEQEQFERTLDRIINILEVNDSRFDSEKFLDYIGPYELKASL